jgi:hypothetical protein
VRLAPRRMTPVSPANAMENFIHLENLKLYRRLLSETTDEGKRKSLLDLIRAETAKEVPTPIVCQIKPFD